MILGALPVIQFAVHALRKEFIHFLVGESLLAGRFDNMALRQAIHFLYIFMRNLFNVRMAVFAFNFGMNTHAKGALIDKQQSKRTILVDPAQPRIFMA